MRCGAHSLIILFCCIGKKKYLNDDKNLHQKFISLIKQKKLQKYDDETIIFNEIDFIIFRKEDKEVLCMKKQLIHFYGLIQHNIIKNNFPSQEKLIKIFLYICVEKRNLFRKKGSMKFIMRMRMVVQGRSLRNVQICSSTFSKMEKYDQRKEILVPYVFLLVEKHDKKFFFVFVYFMKMIFFASFHKMSKVLI